MVLKQSRNPFHVVQKFIILGNLDGEYLHMTWHILTLAAAGMVTAMHGWLGDSPNLYLLRFMVNHSVCLTS